MAVSEDHATEAVTYSTDYSILQTVITLDASASKGTSELHCLDSVDEIRHQREMCETHLLVLTQAKTAAADKKQSGQIL